MMKNRALGEHFCKAVKQLRTSGCKLSGTENQILITVLDNDKSSV